VRSAEALRSVLIPLEHADELELPSATKAAVLVPLFERDGELHAVFTRRREDMRRHAGEISFPGGRHDPQDQTLLDTALREAYEEVGLDPATVTPLGALQPTMTIVTGYAIHPFVGLISPAPAAWVLSENEVAEVIELPLRAVRAGYARRRLVRRGLPIRTDTYVVDHHLIWGATARVLADLFDRIAEGLVAEHV
jgi:8-oxo-dGTP pyrophosphatase MutT (NUDIX family)